MATPLYPGGILSHKTYRWSPRWQVETITLLRPRQSSIFCWKRLTFAEAYRAKKCQRDTWPEIFNYISLKIWGDDACTMRAHMHSLQMSKSSRWDLLTDVFILRNEHIANYVCSLKLKDIPIIKRQSEPMVTEIFGDRSLYVQKKMHRSRRGKSNWSASCQDCQVHELLFANS
jgi:hypothetical protein